MYQRIPYRAVRYSILFSTQATLISQQLHCLRVNTVFGVRYVSIVYGMEVFSNTGKTQHKRLRTVHAAAYPEVARNTCTQRYAYESYGTSTRKLHFEIKAFRSAAITKPT